MRSAKPKYCRTVLGNKFSTVRRGSENVVQQLGLPDDGGAAGRGGERHVWRARCAARVCVWHFVGRLHDVARRRAALAPLSRRGDCQRRVHDVRGPALLHAAQRHAPAPAHALSRRPHRSGGALLDCDGVPRPAGARGRRHAARHVRHVRARVDHAGAARRAALVSAVSLSV